MNKTLHEAYNEGWRDGWVAMEKWFRRWLGMPLSNAGSEYMEPIRADVRRALDKVRAEGRSEAEGVLAAARDDSLEQPSPQSEAGAPHCPACGHSLDSHIGAIEPADNMDTVIACKEDGCECEA